MCTFSVNARDSKGCPTATDTVTADFLNFTKLQKSEIYDTEVHITPFISGVLVKGHNGGKQAHRTMVFARFYDMRTRVNFVRFCFLLLCCFCWQLLVVRAS